MDHGSISPRKEGSVGWIIFNRPKVMNALDLDGVQEFLSVLDDMENDGNIKAVILTGSGNAFCAGGNLTFFLRLFEEGIDSIRHFIIQSNRIITKILSMKKFVIAAVNGDAMGGGVSYVLASDMAIASEKARFGLSFMKIGLAPDTGLTYMIPNLVGLQRAKELFSMGAIISASQAMEMNMINKIVPPDQLLNTASEAAQRIACNSSIAMGSMKKLVNNIYDSVDFEAVLNDETELQTLCLQSKESNDLIKKFFKI